MCVQRDETGGEQKSSEMPLWLSVEFRFWNRTHINTQGTNFATVQCTTLLYYGKWNNINDEMISRLS